MKKISKYWLFQICGWGANIALSLFFIITLGKFTTIYAESLVLTCVMGVILTHIMRLQIHKIGLLQKPLKKQILFFIFLTLLYAIIFGICSDFIDRFVGYNFPDRMAQLSRPMRMLFSSINAFWILLIWNFIYFLYHYVERNRQQQLDTLKLEAMVKSLELKTIKAHINPHFIFNALNSIRALVDENPVRARRAITELSNLLRSSMKIEKEETVPLSQELAIVKDYLALEQMRFEERLQVKMEIDDNTLDQPVPPMMLQTLVENAIKHGISRQMYGGEILVSCKMVEGELKIDIVNTGQLLPDNGLAEGFGIKSTQERLKLLYNGKAHFEIKNQENKTVKSSITMPYVAML